MPTVVTVSLGFQFIKLNAGEQLEFDLKPLDVRSIKS